ncbi:MAG: YbaB/EbfC family nucleoid-associated protein [Parachlamydiaceae bacterium]
MGSGFAKKKKEARMLQTQLSQMQEKMQHTEVTGTAGNGLVTLVLNGENQMKSIKIKPECVDPEDVEGLQDLIKAAYADASRQLQEHSASAMPQMSGMPNLSMFGL